VTNIRRILALHSKGASQRAIARLFGMSHPAVGRALRARGVYSAWRGRPRPAAVVADALARYKRGDAALEVAAAVGVGVETVKRWARIAGVSRPQGRRPVWRSEWTAEALRQKREGVTWRAIAEHYGVNPSTAQNNVTRAIRERRLHA